MILDNLSTHKPKHDRWLAVEMVDDDGFTVWFANFNYRRYHKAQSNGTPADAFNGRQERKEV